mmetsp:Transcript_65280/g.147298  ORF Transcript_65280/g.147298 Transcript_65280/m.147298 type:complete len:89 (-) Transcript_65280:511-777(-)
MAIPDTFRFVFVALAAMVAYRFVNELTGDQAAVTNKGNTTEVEAVGGHVMEEEGDTGTEKKQTKGGKGGGVRRHKLKKNEVLIEYCTS